MDLDYKPFTFKDFSKLNSSTNSSFLINSMDSMLEIEGVLEAKKKAISALNLCKHDKVIEFGCGLGLDAKSIWDKINQHGSVTAIDSSISMINEAKNRYQYRNLNFELADFYNLPYSNNSYSAAYADRVVVSQMEPRKIILEMKRLLHPGGKICITDLDYGSLILYPDINNLEKLIADRFIEITQNPFIGRKLPTLVSQLGFSNIKIIPTAYIIDSLSLFNRAIVNIEKIIYDLVYLKKINENQAKEYIEALQYADVNHQFIYSVTLFSVVATK